MKLGSLFDGIGGFPLVASRYGITPVWASEIVPACVSITKRHFPNMKHLGDITKINGAEIEPVDIITFGSPCQDLSVAGKRAGLAGERSGLFGEAVRIIEEMREATDGKYPTIAVWENVPGALSSNGGMDFRAVLQAFAACEVPVPKSGKWATAGMVRGGKCDIAWRILDAQHWGVPQRRRRVFLVADFGGERSAEVLFKPESLRRNFTQSREAWEEVAGSVGSGAEGANSELYENHAADSRITGPVDVCPTVTQRWGTGGGNTPIVCAGGAHANAAVDVDLSPTLTSANDLPYVVHSVHQNQCGEVRMGVVANTLSTNSNASGRNAPLICAGFSAGFCHKALAGAGTVGYQKEIAPTLKARQECAVFACRTDQTGGNGLGVSEDVGYTLDGSNGQAVVSLDCRNLSETEELSGTLQAKNNGGYSLNYINPILQKQIIRRLTPTECERLQGFPDGWTSLGCDSKPISDAARYRALGNSVALPCVDYVLGGIAEVLTCETE